MADAQWNIVYVTSNEFKIAENTIFCNECSLANGQQIKERFKFDIRHVEIKEVLEVELEKMVSAEVTSAYKYLRIPCIVEHAGLIFEDYLERSYPGGLTKAMWNALGGDFIQETKSAGRKAIARAVIGYCDGRSVRTFMGETCGTLASEPRGNREFYWDTVFVPDMPSDCPRAHEGLTYAEIVEDPLLGLSYKVNSLSQSSKAMLKLLDWLVNTGEPELWGRFP